MLLAGIAILALSPAPQIRVPPAFADWPVERVQVGDRTLTVVVAVDQARGLMGVDDLGDLDGMLFEFETPVSFGFWMRGVQVPLELALFDADGRLIEVIAMAVCRADPCPIYPASRPYRWAIETPANEVTFAPGAILRRP